MPFAAIVKIRIEETENSYVKIDCIGDGWIAQGYLESVSENGYKTWKEGAIIGANFALKKSSNSFGITIFEINGIITDKSPTSVGAATIYAVWKAIKYIPNQ